mmetsp:Transcript_8381/g.21362  ORF Transcript_8381/g.21362 Transcript_8381/m.21362 type:complete len:458 (+) Transcript_8381:1289-2662(+)
MRVHYRRWFRERIGCGILSASSEVRFVHAKGRKPGTGLFKLGCLESFEFSFALLGLLAGFVNCGNLHLMRTNTFLFLAISFEFKLVLSRQLLSFSSFHRSGITLSLCLSRSLFGFEANLLRCLTLLLNFTLQSGSLLLQNSFMGFSFILLLLATQFSEFLTVPLLCLEKGVQLSHLAQLFFLLSLPQGFLVSPRLVVLGLKFSSLCHFLLSFFGNPLFLCFTCGGFGSQPGLHLLNLTPELFILLFFKPLHLFGFQSAGLGFFRLFSLSLDFCLVFSGNSFKSLLLFSLFLFLCIEFGLHLGFDLFGDRCIALRHKQRCGRSSHANNGLGLGAGGCKPCLLHAQGLGWVVEAQHVLITKLNLVTLIKLNRVFQFFTIHIAVAYGMELDHLLKLVRFFIHCDRMLDNTMLWFNPCTLKHDVLWLFVVDRPKPCHAFLQGVYMYTKVQARCDSHQMRQS